MIHTDKTKKVDDFFYPKIESIIGKPLENICKLSEIEFNTDPSDGLIGRLRFKQLGGLTDLIGKAKDDGDWHEPFPITRGITKVRRLGMHAYYARCVQFLDAEDRVLHSTGTEDVTGNETWTEFEIDENELIVGLYGTKT